jgi:hypothetical protein
VPEPPKGEIYLRALASRFEDAEARIRRLIADTPQGDRRALLAEALQLLIALRRLDVEGPLLAAYLAAFKDRSEADSDAVSDLAGSLRKKLHQAAVIASDSARQAFRRVTRDNIDEMADVAVVANIDARGTSWTLGHWARMNTDTIGRQASSRGLAHAVGEGGEVVINVGTCQWCQSHAGGGVIGEIALPPYHPSCSCVASAA